MSGQQATMQKNLPSLDYGVGAGVALLIAGLIGFALAKVGSAPLQMALYGEFGELQPADVRAIAAPHLGGGVFALDTDALESRLLELPWAASVQVERLWPDRLAVHVRSHRALAAWEGAVLTREGQLIHPAKLPELELAIAGPQTQAAAVFADLQAVLPNLPESWRLSRWSVSATGDRSAQLKIGVQSLELEFGREPVAEKFRLLADVVLPVLMPRLAEVAAVDLRYRNGFAVRWLAGDVSSERDL